MGEVKNLTLVIPSPVDRVVHPLLKEKNIELHVKREDLIHDKISGNKWRKLKYVISDLRERNYTHAITFGGAFSNHVFSFAYACKLNKIKGVVIIRGEENYPLNPTLQYVHSCGVDIHYISRKEYRRKLNSDSAKAIIGNYPDPYHIPEGGSTSLAYRGIEEMVDEILDQNVKPEFIAISAGTGCTAGCMIRALNGTGIKAEVFSALKGDFMLDEIKNWALKDNGYKVHLNHHCGGYAKTNQELIDFINDFSRCTKIPLDPIYNGKLVFGLFKEIEWDSYVPGTKILWIHTGGLQGVHGFNNRWKGKFHIATS